MTNYKYAARFAHSHQNIPIFMRRVIGVRRQEREFIQKHRHRFIETNSMLELILSRLLRIPLIS